MLDATTSEIKVDMEELLSARKQVPVVFEELNLDATEGFHKDNLRYAKVNESQEAKNIVDYKLKYIYPDKEILTGVAHLVNIPIWEFEFDNKKLIIYGNDKNYKKTIQKWLEEQYPKQTKNQIQLFAETMQDIKKPKNIWKDFITTVKKTNPWVFLIALVIITTLIYLIIHHIVAKLN